MKAHQFWAKTDRKGQNSDAAEPSNEEVAQFMEEHDHAEDE
jgi:hypothetical protein